jgi:hypothetical protein
MKTYNEQGQEIRDIQMRKKSNQQIKKNLKNKFSKQDEFKNIEDKEEQEKAISKAVKREYYTKFKIYSPDSEQNTEKMKKAVAKYEQKDIKKQQELKEEDRKKYNAKLKKGYREPMALVAVKQEYYDQKILSDKEQAKKTRKDYNQKLKQELLKKYNNEDDPQFKLEYAENALYPPGEKGRKQRNEAIKKLVDKKTYYEEKKLLKPGKGFEFKEHSATTDITSIVGGLNQTANISSMGALQIGKLTGNTKVSGKKLLDDNGNPVKDNTGKDVMKEYGQAEQSQMITSSVGDIIGIVDSSVGIANGVERRKSDDPAEQMMAGEQIVDSSFELASNVVSGASNIAKTVRSFAGGTSEIGQNVTTAIPIIGIVGNVLDLVQAGKVMAEAAHRARIGLKLIKDSVSKKDLTVSLSLENLRNEDLKLVTSKTIDVLLYSLQVTGQALTLSGLGATVGTPMLYAAKIAGGAKKVASMIYGEVYARSVKKARNKYEDVHKDQKSDPQALFLAAQELLKKDTKQAIQTIISQAKKGNEQAIAYLEMFGINRGDLRDPRMKDQNLRELICHKIEQEEDPKTIKEKISGLMATVKDLKNLKYKIRKGVASL